MERQLPIFDELGRPLGMGFRDVHLEEELATRLLPTPEEAVDGILSI